MENKKEWWVEGTKQCIEANLNSGSGMAIYYAMEHIKTLVAQQETEAVRRRNVELLNAIEELGRSTDWNAGQRDVFLSIKSLIKAE